jgi:hypothetical protein
MVARFYLERFAVDGNVELVHRDDFGRSFPIGVKKALAENYFYSVDTDEGRNPTGETILADHVDTPAAEAIRRVFDEGRSLNAPGPRRAISLFLAFQSVRGPGQRQAAVEHARASGRKLMSMATPADVMRVARAHGEEMTEERASAAAEFALSGRYTIEVPHPANLHLDLAFGTAIELVPLFYDRFWRVLEFKEPTLITSDEPVALVGSEPQRTGPPNS